MVVDDISTGRDAPTLEDKLAFLRRAGSYPDQPVRIEAVETHMSWVFLTDTHAWKLKKPVRTPYLDFSTVRARHHDCLLELTLNSRLAGGVYQHVAPLTMDRQGALHIGTPGIVVDWLVQMRKLPRERMLDAAIESRTAGEPDLHRVAELLSRFYQRSPPCELNGDEYRGLLVETIEENRRTLTDSAFDIPHETAIRLLDGQESFVHRRPRLLDERIRLGHVIEAHGDLRPEHIGLEPRPVVIDCLEFNRRLRLLDTASELTFLALECDRLGAAWIGEGIRKTCERLTGDYPQPLLLPFYRDWHACTRARIALLHLRDHEVRDPQKWIGRARWYLSR
jgi:aminoglycoside phosphotransferase family enzyme